MGRTVQSGSCDDRGLGHGAAGAGAPTGLQSWEAAAIPRQEGSTPSSLRQLPSVDRFAVAIARSTLSRRRAELLAGAQDAVDLLARADELARPSLRRVLNATGVIVHTNLGRARLSDSARAAVLRAADGYSNLELELDSGVRSTRHAHVEPLLCELTGAEAAMPVNNGAAAVLLCAAALASGGRQLVVSRGQLVEIGGGFRIPEVVEQAGSRLIEVGTTNRTHLEDYRGALTEHTGAVLRVHPSNFRTLGFVEEVAIEDLCRLGPPVIDDLGSGLLVDDIGALADEPPVCRSVNAGAALVCFSGDKLLGGPQAGLIVGRRDAVNLCRRHPLARAMRIDKLSLAALEATLSLYRDPELACRQIPVLAMLAATEEELQRRAETLAQVTGGEIVSSVARVGGGALPLVELHGPAVALDGPADALARALRTGEPAVIGRIERGRLLLDVRTLTDAEVSAVGSAVRTARGE